MTNEEFQLIVLEKLQKQEEEIKLMNASLIRIEKKIDIANHRISATIGELELITLT